MGEDNQQPEEDVLLKLTMPGKELRQSTLEKAKQVPGEKTEQQLSPAKDDTANDELLQKISKKPQQDSLISETVTEDDTDRTPVNKPPHISMQGNMGQIKNLAESFWNSDKGRAKKPKV